MAKRTNTAPLILSNLNDHGDPIRLTCTLDDLLNDVAQMIRKTGHAQRMAETEGVTQVVIARLSVELLKYRADSDLIP